MLEFRGLLNETKEKGILTDSTSDKGLYEDNIKRHQITNHFKG